MSRTVRHKVANSAMLLVAARIFSRGFDFIALIVLARQLTPGDFGLVAIALSVVQITEAIMEVPTSIALLQLRSVSRSYLNSAFTLALIRGLAIIAILCALAAPLAHFFGDQRLIALICALSLAPACRALRSPKAFLLFKHLRFGPDAAADVFGKFCALLIAILIALKTGSYWAIAAATISGPMVYVIATYVLVPMRPRLTTRNFGYFYGFIGWSMGAQAMNALNWQADRFLLGKLATQATVGLFATARDFAATVFRALMEAMQRPLMSALSRSNHDLERQREVYGMSIATVLSIGIPLACGQALMAAELVELVLGPQWLEATFVFQAVSLALIPALYSHMTLTLLYAVGKPKLIFTRNLIDFIFRVPLIFICIFAFGWVGAVFALVAADLFLAGLCMDVARRVIGIGIGEQLAKAARGLSSAAVMAAVVLAMRHTIPRGDGAIEIAIYLIKIVPAGVVTYCLVHWLIWRLLGRPDGIERLAGQIVPALAARLKRGTAKPA